MPSVVISTENLHKFYGTRDQKVHALRGLDLSIEEGDIVGVMGPSGCGKTTLLNCLSGLDSIDDGNIIGDYHLGYQQMSGRNWQTFSLFIQHFIQKKHPNEYKNVYINMCNVYIK